MSNRVNNEAEVLRVLGGILEEAIDAGANVVELEYVDSGLEACYMFGNMGIGTLIKPELEGEVISIIVKKAKLGKRLSGKMQMELNGEKHSIIVEEYESFGETAFKLILEK
jgi:hypothetical protein